MHFISCLCCSFHCSLDLYARWEQIQVAMVPAPLLQDGLKLALALPQCPRLIPMDSHSIGLWWNWTGCFLELLRGVCSVARIESHGSEVPMPQGGSVGVKGIVSSGLFIFYFLFSSIHTCTQFPLGQNRLQFLSMTSNVLYFGEHCLPRKHLL